MRHITQLCVLFLGIIALSLPLSAETSKGMGVGEPIPHQLNLKNQKTQTQSFSKLVGEKGVVLVFVRSADWCPFCQNQLIDFQNNKMDFYDKGYTIVSISYDSPEILAKFAAKNDISFTMLSDTGSKMIKDFGLLNTSHEEGSRFYGIPYPTIFVVGRDGIITHKFAEEGYRNRPEIKDILASLN